MVPAVPATVPEREHSREAGSRRRRVPVHDRHANPRESLSRRSELEPHVDSGAARKAVARLRVFLILLSAVTISLTLSFMATALVYHYEGPDWTRLAALLAGCAVAGGAFIVVLWKEQVDAWEEAEEREEPLSSWRRDRVVFWSVFLGFDAADKALTYLALSLRFKARESNPITGWGIRTFGLLGGLVTAFLVMAVVVAVLTWVVRRDPAYEYGALAGGVVASMLVVCLNVVGWLGV